MNYPLLSEYIEAIKSAEDNFNELSSLQIIFQAKAYNCLQFLYNNRL